MYGSCGVRALQRILPGAYGGRSGWQGIPHLGKSCHSVQCEYLGTRKVCNTHLVSILHLLMSI